MNKRVFNALRKTSSATTDVLSRFTAQPAGMLLNNPLLGTATDSIGGLIGSFDTADSRSKALQSLADREDGKWWSLVPGIGGYRTNNRKTLMRQILAKDTAEHSALSRGIYDRLKWLNPLNILAAPISALTAAATDTHSLKDQKEIADDPNYGLKSMLIPGWNSYQGWKALGSSDKLSGLENLTEDDMQTLAKADPELVEEVQRLRAARTKQKPSDQEKDNA